MTLFILPTIIYCLKDHDKIEEIDQVIEGQKTAPIINGFVWSIIL